jgi:hypothetical protein
VKRDGVTWWCAGVLGSFAVLAACTGELTKVEPGDGTGTETSGDDAATGTGSSGGGSSGAGSSSTSSSGGSTSSGGSSSGGSSSGGSSSGGSSSGGSSSGGSSSGGSSSGGSSSGSTDGGSTDGGSTDAGGATSTNLYCSKRESFNAFLSKTSTATWACTATTRSLASNGIPDHQTGNFPSTACPNTISTQTISVTMPFVPAKAAMTSRPQIVGYAVNGVKLEPGTGGTCSVTNGTVTCSLAGGGGTWRIEALGQTKFDFGADSSNAHVQPTGEYHYHGMPHGLMTVLGQGVEMKLVAFAMDGYPIYAKYGYTVPTDSTSQLKVLTASYKTKAVPDANRPSTTDYPMGVFVQDWEYQAGLGDLDDCNGRTGVTPDFPGGIYYYVITDTYPFIGRCVKGTPGTSTTNGVTSGGGGGGGDGGMPPPDGGPPPPPPGG